MTTYVRRTTHGPLQLGTAFGGASDAVATGLPNLDIYVVDPQFAGYGQFIIFDDLLFFNDEYAIDPPRVRQHPAATLPRHNPRHRHLADLLDMHARTMRGIAKKYVVDYGKKKYEESAKELSLMWATGLVFDMTQRHPGCRYVPGADCVINF